MNKLTTFLTILLLCGTISACLHEPTLTDISSRKAGKGAPEIRRNEFVQDKILVKFRDGVSSNAINALNSRYGTTVEGKISGIDVYRLRIPPGRTVAEMVKLYRKEDIVEYAEPDYTAYALPEPKDKEVNPQGEKFGRRR